jgi:hypothetical protein
MRASLAGEPTRLRSDLTINVKSRARRVTVRGLLDRAGEEAPAGAVTVRAVAGARVRSVKAGVRDGAFTAKLGQLAAGRWRIVASAPGTRWHLGARSPTAKVTVR